MLREIKRLGFDLVELSHGIRVSLMPGIQKVFDAGEVRFSSLHNFCPMPVGVTSPDRYQFSALDSREREHALKQTFQTIDFAQRLGAPVVVLHLGSVSMNPITDQLIQLIRKGQIFSREYVEKKVKSVQEREAAAPPYLAFAKECLQRLADYATKRNVRLGIEGRRGYEEIPSERELPALLEEINSPALGYWHDMGHTQIKENLGFLDHEEWLRAIGNRTLGCHLQDCIWPARDHQPPFAGQIDFQKLVPLLPSTCLFVWEMSPRKTREEIQRSVTTWKERFGG